MKRRRATLLMAVIGVLGFLAIMGVSLGAWFFAAAFERETADAPAAMASFDEVRQRFGGTAPVLDVVEDGKAVLRRLPPAEAPVRPLERLQVLVWDREDGGLSRVTLPFWLVRLKTGPIDLSSTVMVNHHQIDLTVEQIERYGPTLLLDHEPRSGDRLLVWTE
jgi:hypothetical protein